MICQYFLEFFIERICIFFIKLVGSVIVPLISNDKVKIITNASIENILISKLSLMNRIGKTAVNARKEHNTTLVKVLRRAVQKLFRQ